MTTISHLYRISSIQLLNNNNNNDNNILQNPWSHHSNDSVQNKLESNPLFKMLSNPLLSDISYSVVNKCDISSLDAL